MLGTGPRRVLGLAIGEKAIHVAEVQAAHSAGRLLRWASFAVPADAGWEQPKELGLRFRAFLREQHFSTRQAIVGLPGRWMLLKPRTLPPVASSAAIGILRLAVEREYQADARQWVFDFAGAADASRKTTVLLVATPQERLTQVTTALEAAGLRTLAVTSTTLALATAGQSGSGADSAGAVLHLSPDGAELAIRSEGQIVAVERLAGGAMPNPGGAVHAPGAPAANPGAGADARSALVASEIRRALATVQSDAGNTPRTLTIWDATGQAAPTFGDLGRKVGLTSRINPDLHELGLLNGSVKIDGPADGKAGAVMLALDAIRRPAGRVDFLHSRLAAERPRLITSRRAIMAAALVLVVGGIVYVVADWFGQTHAVSQLKAELAVNDPPLKEATANLDRVRLVRGWYDTRPPLLDCLHDVTAAFPPAAGQVWATSLVVREDLTGTLAGKAQDERSALELRDRLMASKKFADVKLVYYRQAERNSKVVSFALTFLYKGRAL